MKKWKFTLGVDVSKLTLDVSCSELNEHIKIKNGSEGFVQFLKWCRKLKIDLQEAFLVLEYTGGYDRNCCNFVKHMTLFMPEYQAWLLKILWKLSEAKMTKLTLRVLLNMVKKSINPYNRQSL